MFFPNIILNNGRIIKYKLLIYYILEERRYIDIYLRIIYNLYILINNFYTKVKISYLLCLGEFTFLKSYCCSEIFQIKLPGQLCL